MAPLPQNNTARVFFDYVTGEAATSQEHTVAFRVPSSQEPAVGAGVAAGVILALGAANFWTGWKVVRARFQAQGSVFTTPIVIPTALAVFVGAATGVTYQPACEALEATFQGRSPTSGRRVDFSLYGLAYGMASVPPNFRVNGGPGGPAWLNTVLTYLNDPSHELLCIDGTPPTWYAYMNVNFNSYWEGSMRRA